MLLSLIGVAAWAQDTASFTLNIDNPEAVKVEINDSTYSVVAGDNEFTAPLYASVHVSPISPYAIESIVCSNTGSSQSIYGGGWYLYPSSYNDGYVYVIKTYNLDESRTASCTINVDDASKVSLSLPGTNTVLTLEDGENIVKFNPENEKNLTIYATDYYTPIYSVTVDGTNIAASYGTYYVTLTDGCVVDITAIIPDIDCTLTFNYGEGAEGAIASIVVDDEAVEFDGTTAVVKAGSKISINANNLYAIDSFYMNGISQWWSGSYAFTTTIMADAEFEVEAHQLQIYNATLIVDDPDALTIYYGYAYQNNVIPVVVGENAIQVTENSRTISWKFNADYYATAIIVNGEAMTASYESLQVSDGDIIEFQTAAKVYDMTSVFWIDDIDAANYYLSVDSYDRTTIEVNTGYTVVNYYAGMSPFYIGWASSNSSEMVNKLYVDTVAISPKYENGTTFEAEVPNNSVVKIFLVTEPVLYDVKVSVADGIDADIVRDVIIPVTESEFSTFVGTEITITADGAVVKANDTEVEAVDGVYTVVVNGDTEISVESKDATGIASVAADNADADVYNLQGIRVATKDSVNKLPAGIYIVSGRKVVVK